MATRLVRPLYRAFPGSVFNLELSGTSAQNRIACSLLCDNDNALLQCMCMCPREPLLPWAAS